MNLIDKIKRLVTGGATTGERQAAGEALRRLEVKLGITSDSQKTPTTEVTLIPLAMITPIEACIYAPSRIQKPVVIRKADLPLPNSTLLVSLDLDGKSNARETLIYGHLTGYWMVK